MKRTRILIVDDHPMLRAGLKTLFDSQPDLLVVGEAGDLREAIDLAARCQPEVITLDLSMPGGAGVAGVQRLTAASTGARVLVLTMHDDPAYLRTALAFGASGYVVKSAAEGELLAAVRAVRNGRVFVDLEGSGAIDGLVSSGAAPKGATPINELSEREREILVEVALGHTSQATATKLGLSVKTVESYRARMMQKLSLKNRADVVRIAVEAGLLDGPAGHGRS